jgi:hypothetical protein
MKPALRSIKPALIFQHDQRLGDAHRDDRVTVIHLPGNGDWPTFIIHDGRRGVIASSCASPKLAGVKASPSSNSNNSSRVALFMKNSSSLCETRVQNMVLAYASMASR